jgi:hypothetical protein
MFMRYLHLAILATTAASALSQSAHESADMARQLAGDFDWDIQAEDGYPIIAFDQDNDGSEIIFLYNFTGTMSETKFFEGRVFLSDCTTTGDGSLVSTGTITGDKLQVDIDVLQEYITQSDFYDDLNGTACPHYILRPH